MYTSRPVFYNDRGYVKEDVKKLIEFYESIDADWTLAAAYLLEMIITGSREED